ncbi:MAG: DNA-binding response regulator [Ramlibacter sp.]|nr:DNA-binding response regulator [Ramlibacter sp.]
MSLLVNGTALVNHGPTTSAASGYDQVPLRRDAEWTAPTASGSAQHVLMVDDDPSMCRMVADFLGDYDFRVTAVSNGRAMAEALGRDAIDLLVLDLRLPGEDGMQIARQLREQSDLAIIVVTGRHAEADRVMALELGADDYVTKPFSPRELLARIRALLRRTRSSAAAIGAGRTSGVRAYRFAGWELVVGLRRLTSPDGRVVPLSNGEFNLLASFVRSPQRVLTRADLLELSRLHDDEVYERAIDVQVGRLRRKLVLAGTPQLIQTTRGAGYLFAVPVEALR